MIEQPLPKKSICIHNVFSKISVSVPTMAIRDSLIDKARVYGNVQTFGAFEFTLQVIPVYDVKEVVDYLVLLAG